MRQLRGVLNANHLALSAGGSNFLNFLQHDVVQLRGLTAALVVAHFYGRFNGCARTRC
jgi:hypothetical protein